MPAAGTGREVTRLSTDVVSSWFYADAMAATAYERTGRFVDLTMLLGSHIMGEDRETALAEHRLARPGFRFRTGCVAVPVAFAGRHDHDLAG